MSLKTFITSIALLAGSSTAALAAPAFTVQASADFRVGGNVDIRDHRTHDWSVIRDHRHHEQPGVVMQPAPFTDDCANVRIGATASVYTGPVGTALPGSWIAITQPTMIGRGGEQINVGADKGQFRTLQLVSNAGSTYLTQVVIQFANGEYLSVPVNRTLNGSMTINLTNNLRRGRAINRIMVEGSSSFGARYSVLAA